MKANSLFGEIWTKINLRRICMLTTLLFAMPLSAATQQMIFDSPQEAVKVLISTVKEDNTEKLMQILGKEAKPLLESGDTVEDKINREHFIKAYEEANKLDKSSDTKYVLEIGKEAWQFPIPVVKSQQGWRFDTAAGKEEILNRRIGENELSAIQAVLAYVDAQREYYLANPQKGKLSTFAQKFLSSSDQRDGLYYPVKEGEASSPLGELFAHARTAGYGEKTGTGLQPYQGYYYRILFSQGADAQGGAYDYVVKGKMVGGHALIAWPASYGNSGVMTFTVNQDGVVYQKDFGPNTATAVQKIKKFNPDKTWELVKKEHQHL